VTAPEEQCEPELHAHASLGSFLHISSTRSIRRQKGNISALLRDMN